MGEFDTGRDLLRHMLRRVGEILPTAGDESQADRLTEAKLYLQDAYWWVCRQRPYRWARRNPPLQFTSVAEVEVTVATIAGATVTLSASLASSVEGRKLMLDADGVPHRIGAHAAGSASLTLVTAYTGETTSGAGRIFQDEVTVAGDILAWPTLKEVRTGAHWRIVPEAELDEIAPANTASLTRNVRYAAFITASKIRLVPWTREARLFECSYNYRPSPLTFDGSPTDTPIVPPDFRAVIAWRAAWKLAHDRDQGSTKRAQALKEEVDDLLQQLQAVEVGFQQPRTYVPRGHRISGR